jgi:Fic family protein
MHTFKAGKYINQGTYRSFQPNPIFRNWVISDMQLINLLTQADRSLGKLDMYSNYIPNMALFISMHITKEATQSCKIEGTQTNMEEALMDKEDIVAEKRNDWEEVHNYIRAMNDAIHSLETLPFSSRLIKQAHGILLQSVRGEYKMPGEFRTSQNWIGGPNIATATFVPPVHDTIQELMADIEKLAHEENNILPDLLKIALIHYQFETIHPFLDGNGRIGRLMITLYLVDKGILKKPILYLSDFLEKNRSHYYDNLTRVREKNDVLHWFKFFLTGIIETAEKSINTFDRIMQLEKQVNEKLKTLGKRNAKAQLVMNYLYQKPIVNAQAVQKIIGSQNATAYSLIEELVRLEIIKETTGFQRNRTYIFDEYIQLFK